ncbi:unnamed protein product [Calypogeia fissa]
MVPWPGKSKPHKKVVVEGERATSPPQASTRPLPVDEDVVMVDLVKVIVEVTDSGRDCDLSSVKILRVDPNIVARAQHESHWQFWSDMGLRGFAALDWGCKMLPVTECQEFV